MKAQLPDAIETVLQRLERSATAALDAAAVLEDAGCNKTVAALEAWAAELEDVMDEILEFYDDPRPGDDDVVAINAQKIAAEVLSICPRQLSTSRVTAIWQAAGEGRSDLTV